MRLTSAQQRRITSLDLLTMLWITQTWKVLPFFVPRIRYWFILNLSSRTARSFSGRQLLVNTQPVLVNEVITSHVMDLSFSFKDLHYIPLCPFLQASEIPLNGSTTIWKTGLGKWQSLHKELDLSFWQAASLPKQQVGLADGRLCLL